MSFTDALPNLYTLGAQIAAHLPGWHIKNDPDTPTHYIALVNGDGPQIGIHRRGYGNDRGRLEVSGRYPLSLQGTYRSARDWGAIPYNAEEPSIGVGGTRSPEAIAKEILRRFLPVYLDVYAKCQATAEKAAQAERETLDDLAKVAAAFGAVVTEEGKRSRRVSVHSEGAGYGTLEPYAVQLRGMPAGMLEEIGAVYRKYAGARQ